MNNWKTADAFRYVRSELTPDEAASFESAMSSNAELQQAVTHAREVRSLIRDAIPAAESLDAIQVQRALVNGEPVQKPESRLVSWQVPAFAMAALATIVVAIISAQGAAYEPLWAWTAPPGHQDTAPQWVRLMDGSEALPGPDTVWQVDQQSEQGIQLSVSNGTLELKVTKDTKRSSFAVVAHGVTTSVLGTQFLVSTDQTGRVDVEVLEGLVEVKADTVTLELGQGDKAHRKDKNSVLSSGAYEEPVANADTGPEGKAAKESAKDSPTVAAPSLKKRRLQASIGKKVKAKKKAIQLPEEKEAAVLEEDPPLEVIEIEIPPQHQEVASAQPTEAKPVAPPRAKGEERSEAVGVIELLQRGSAKTSLERIGSLLAKYPNHRYRNDLLYLKGYAHHLLGNKDQARSLWKKYETAEPQGAWLRTVGDWLHPSQPTAAKLR